MEEQRYNEQQQSQVTEQLRRQMHALKGRVIVTVLQNGTHITCVEGYLCGFEVFDERGKVDIGDKLSLQ